MKITNFEIRERKLNKLNSVTYTGDLNVDTFHFDFDEEWMGLDKTLVIIADVSTYNIPLLNDEAVLPSEVYMDNQSITVGVFGRNSDTILSSNLINISLTKGAYIEGEEPSNLPTPTQWDLYIQEINRLLDEAKATEEECKRVLEEIRLINEKMEEYDLNHEEKIEEYNENTEEKVNEFNINATNKTDEFNSKAQEKVDELNTAFDENVEEKLNDFNTNSTNKLNEFNENVTSKTTDFNTNVVNKTNEFNSNVENKKQELEADYMKSDIYDPQGKKQDIFNYVDTLENQLEYDSEKWGEVLGSNKQGVDFKTEYVWRLGWINGTTGSLAGDSAIDGDGDINWTHTDFIETFEGAVFNLSNMYSGQSIVGGLTFYDASKKILPDYTKSLGPGTINYTVPEGSNIKYVRVCTSYQTAEKWAQISIIGGASGCISTPKENIDNLYKKVNTYASKNEKGAVRMWTQTVGTITTLYIATEEEIV